MLRYEFLDHTADAKFRAYGSTLEEGFANAALALASLMWDWERIPERTVYSVEIRGRDLEQLLSRFLEEIIYLMETKNFLLGTVDDMTISEETHGYSIKAAFKGDHNNGGYEIHGEVKAVTYNEMKIEKTNGVTVQVVVDV